MSETTGVKWPGNAYDPEGDDLSVPVQQFLRDLSLLAEPDEKAGIVKTPESVQVMSAGATALSKGWSTLIGVFGGGGAIAAALAGFGASPTDTPLQRAVFVASAAVLLAAAVTAVAMIVKADVTARARASSAEYTARGHVVRAVLQNFPHGGAPTKYWLRKKINGRTDLNWHPVSGFKWDDDAQQMLAQIDGGNTVPWDNVAEWTTCTNMHNSA
jgi:hypothetical protein